MAPASVWLISMSQVNKTLRACMSFSVALLLQGTEDEVIDIRHGKRLHELAKLKSQPLWAEGHNHQVGLQRVLMVCGRPSVNMTFCMGWLQKRNFDLTCHLARCRISKWRMATCQR